MKVSGIVFLLFCALACADVKDSEPKEAPWSMLTTTSVVSTSSGTLLGTRGDGVIAFLGIPYAEPPVGERRFKKPSPVKSWEGVLEANAKPPPCMQYSSAKSLWYATSKPSEDCLYLNIWVPETYCSKQGPLPVMVWIHGGGYVGGSSEMDIYDGAILASRGNVIVASMNYRLGSLGFMSSGDEAIPLNLGLYDQNLAMKWIHQNVRGFGGDDDSITLFGESAGSVSVGFHLLSPLSAGLFKRAIMQSGSPYHPLLADNPQIAKAKTNVFATAIQCATDESNMYTDPKKVVACLSQKDSLEMEKVDDQFVTKNAFYFLPGYGDEFMPVNPIDAAKTGRFDQVELLIGNIVNEGALFLPLLVPQVFSYHATPVLNLEIGKQILYSMFQNVTILTPESVVDFYLKKAKDSESIVRAISDAYGDYIFRCPAFYFAEKMGSVHYYWYEHRPAKSDFPDWMTPSHFSDVPFVFGKPVKGEEQYDEEDRAFSLDVIKKWVSFARHGNPLEPDSSDQTTGPDSWPLFTADDPVVRDLRYKKQRVHAIPSLEACRFWRPHFVPASE